MGSVRGEVLSALRELKWTLTALGMGGLKDFPQPPVDHQQTERGIKPKGGGKPTSARVRSIPVDSTPPSSPTTSDVRYAEHPRREGPVSAMQPLPDSHEQRAAAILAGSDRMEPLPFGVPQGEKGDGLYGAESLPEVPAPQPSPRMGEGAGMSLPDLERGALRGPDTQVHGRRDAAEALQGILTEMGDCKRCRLHSGRKNLVFADGSSRARLVFVGEGPGFDEDQQGLPFVGRAGKLLDKMIHALELQRGEVYICNVVKCRPPSNRTPEREEIEICSPFLFRQLDAIYPRVICALGACAAQTLLGSASPISRLRGKVHYWRGIPLICTFHPAYLLRNPAQKAAAWQDLLEIRGLIHDEE